MTRLRLSCLAVALSVCVHFSCARLHKVDEQSELDAPSHVDFADVLDHAMSLMDEGLSNFMKQKETRPSLRAETNTALSLLSEMSGNVKALRKVVGKMKTQQRHQAAKTQRQLKQLSLAARREKQYQTDLLRLQNFSSQCDQALKRCPPSGVAQGLMPELQQITHLQGLNDVLREKVGQLGNQKRILQGEIDDLSAQAKETQAFKRKVESLEADNQQLQAALQQAAQGEQDKIQEEVGERIAEAKAKMEDGFAARKRMIKRQEQKIMEKSEDSQEVAQDLQNQNVKYQKSNIHLNVANERLKHENQALRDDKAHLMESMQSLLRQSAEYQKELLTRESCKSQSNKTVAKAKEAPAQCQCSGVSESAPYTAEDIAKAQAAADAAAPVASPVHRTNVNVPANSDDPFSTPADSSEVSLSSTSFSKEQKKNKYDGDFAIDEDVPVYSPKSPNLYSSVASATVAANDHAATTSNLEDSLTLPSKLRPKGEVEVRKAEAAMGLKHVTGEKVLAGYLDGEPPPPDIQNVQTAAPKQPQQGGLQKTPRAKPASSQVKAASVASKADTADASAQLLLKAEQEIADAGNDAQ